MQHAIRCSHSKKKSKLIELFKSEDTNQLLQAHYQMSTSRCPVTRDKTQTARISNSLAQNSRLDTSAG